MIGKLPMPAPKSLSSAQKPVITEAGTPYSCPARSNVAAMLDVLAPARLHAVVGGELALEVEERLREDGALLAVARDDVLASGVASTMAID